MAWSSSDLDYKSLIHEAEASLSAAAAADETTASVPTAAPAAVVTQTFGASPTKGDGMRLAQKLKKDGYTEEEAKQKFIEGRWSESHVTKMMERFNSTDADAEETPSVSKKKKGDGLALARKYKAEGKHAYDCKVELKKMGMVETSASRTIKDVYDMSVKEYTKKYGPSAAAQAAAAAAAAASAEEHEVEVKKLKHGDAPKLAKKCKEDGMNPIQCKRALKKAGVPDKSLCRYILKVYNMSVTEWKTQNPEEAENYYEDSDEEELATRNPSSSAASGSGLTPEQRAQVPTVGETAPAASSLPMPRFAFESLD